MIAGIVFVGTQSILMLPFCRCPSFLEDCLSLNYSEKTGIMSTVINALIPIFSGFPQVAF